MGKLKEAKRYFEKAESLKEDQVSTLYYLGCIYQQEGNLQAAKEKLEKAFGCNINPLSTISREAIQQKLEEINRSLQSSSLK
jgi:tetratricopeptide (TPR) repeat protein